MQHSAEVIDLCVEEYLRYIRSLRYALQDIEREIEELEQTLTLTGVSYSDASSKTHNSHDRLGDGVVKLLELKDKLTGEQAAHADELSHARNICRFSEPRQAVWLSRVERLTYAQIAKQLGYSTRTIRRMIIRGRREIYSVMPEYWRRYTIPDATPHIEH